MSTEFLNVSLWENLLLALKFLYKGAPFYLPVFFGIALFNSWIWYRRNEFWAKQKSILLEIKLPKEIMKSPAAMEVVFNSFFHTVGESTFIDRIFYGKTRFWFSLEIVSLSGQIHFYIWLNAAQKGLIENAIYAQYPEVEVHEVPDYTLPYSYDPEKNNIWCCEWKLTGPDALPIKTYIDYGLDKDPKEEFKIDPMSSFLEFMGSLTEGNMVWMQIIIRAHRKSRLADVFAEQEDSWKEEAKKQVEDIMSKINPEDKEKKGRPPTEGEKDTMSAIGRSVSKIPFDVGIRTLYIAEKDKFNPSNIGGVTGAFRQYSYGGLNGFAPTGGVTGFDDFWKDPSGSTREFRKKMLLAGYKARQIFYPPYKGNATFVLNAEELATIFHFPGSVVKTPTFARISSKKSEAPPNLPI